MTLQRNSVPPVDGSREPAASGSAHSSVQAPPARGRGNALAGLALIAAVVAVALGFGAWKRDQLHKQAEAAAHQPEPMEAASAALAREIEHVDSTTAIGTVRALRSITLRTELPGRVSSVALEPGAIVEAGTLLVAFDVSVEQAELKAQEARAVLAETLLSRTERARDQRGASEMDVDRARAERDVARAEVARLAAILERKTIRAPFRARVGLADVHPGQYLDAGAELTTLQGIDEAVHVDFHVAQAVGEGLRVGGRVEIGATGIAKPIPATIVAIDARVDPLTRNALVRARVEGEVGGELAPASGSPGSSVRVRIPIGPARHVVAVPVSALRKGPSGDHVFVLSEDDHGQLRAHERNVQTGSVLGDEVIVSSGLASGERVATSGSFKLREGVLVVVPAAAAAAAAPQH